LGKTTIEGNKLIKARHITTKRDNVNKTLKRYLQELDGFEILFITESAFKSKDFNEIKEYIHYTFFYREGSK
jgi:DNA-binding protein Fis